MNQVESLPLWLGHAGEGRDFRRIFDAGIEALVHLAVEDSTPYRGLARMDAYDRKCRTSS